MKKYTSIGSFLADLPEDKTDQVEALRSIIRAASPDLIENIKWNAPNYSYKDLDRITFNLQNKDNKVKLVLHMGALIAENKKASPIMDDPSGLIKWNSNIRGLLTFDDLADINTKRAIVSKILKEWLQY